MLHKHILSLLPDCPDDSLEDGVAAIPHETIIEDAGTQYMPKRLRLTPALPAGGVPHLPHPPRNHPHRQKIEPSVKCKLVVS